MCPSRVPPARPALPVLPAPLAPRAQWGLRAPPVPKALRGVTVRLAQPGLPAPPAPLVPLVLPALLELQV